MASGKKKYDFSFLDTLDEDSLAQSERESSILTLGITPIGAKANRRTPGILKSSKSTGLESSGAVSGFLSVPRTGLGTHSTAVRTATRTPAVQTAYVVALVEGRGQAKGEIGMACVDLKRAELILSQFPDTQTYVRVITKLSMLQPLEVIMPNTACEGANLSRLYKLVTDQFPSTNLVTVQRKYFNESKGLQYVNHLCVPEYSSVGMEVASKYYTLAAAAALIKYIEFIQNIVYAPKSMKVMFKGSEQTMMIDVATVKNLELITNTHNPSSRHSLFGVLDHTKTAMGSRFLRSNILQPPQDLETITLRLDCVTELTEHEEMFYSVQSVLGRFLDIDHLITACVQIPKQDTLKTAENRIAYAIHLKHVLELVDPLRAALEEATNPLLVAYRETLADSRFKAISEKIKAVIHDDTRYQKGTLNMRTQKCFAIKPKINGLLDVARRTYTETVDDVSGLVVQLSEQHNLPLKSGYSSSRGFYIQLNAGPAGTTPEDLPGQFLKVSRQRNTLSFTTSDLIRLNDRIKESLSEIYLMTNVVVSQLLEEVREMIGCLYKLSECVAAMDMLVSFAHMCTVSTGYVRPELTDTLALQQCRHPILDKTSKSKVIPNNAYCCRENNFTVITGPNMSGKSTYLKQIALIQVMGQIGSFVPATYASLRLADQIFTRIGSDDDIETNSSTFMLEMKEVNYIVQNVTSDSLVIIDELGRGTSSEEGVGICFAICEHLLRCKAFTFFATHALELTALDALYPNVTNYHLEVKHSLGAHGNQIIYTHVLTRGKTQEKNYGVFLAEMSTLPSDVVTEAKEILQHLQKSKQDPGHKEDLLKFQRSHFQLSSHLIQLAKNSKLNHQGLVAYMKFLKEKYSWLKDQQVLCSTEE